MWSDTQIASEGGGEQKCNVTFFGLLLTIILRFELSKSLQKACLKKCHVTTGRGPVPVSPMTHGEGGIKWVKKYHVLFEWPLTQTVY